MRGAVARATLCGILDCKKPAKETMNYFNDLMDYPVHNEQDVLGLPLCYNHLNVYLNEHLLGLKWQI